MTLAQVGQQLESQFGPGAALHARRSSGTWTAWVTVVELEEGEGGHAAVRGHTAATATAKDGLGAAVAKLLGGNS